VMGAPSMGAKVGAIPSAGIAVGVGLIALLRGRVRSRDVALVVLAALALLAAASLFDLARSPGSRTHLAVALTGGGGGPLEIARRKLSMEGYLLLHSPWSATLLASTAGIAWLMKRSPTLATHRGVTVCIAALTAGSIAAVLCNDSGVVAAS